MNWRLNVIALTVYSLLGVTAGSVVFLTMRQWSREVAQRPADSTQTGLPPTAPAAHLDKPLETFPAVGNHDENGSRDLQLLRALLDERNEQVQEMREKLAASQSRVTDLQRRYDRMLAMMDDWIEIVDTMGTDVPNETGGETSDAPMSENTTGDTTSSDGAQQRADDLRRELETVTLELTMREDQLETVTEELIERRAMMQAMANQLLAPIITTALPRLEALLSDRRPSVRKWTCETLAAIGSPARDAAEPLRVLLAVESDQEVRAAAERALDSITD